MSEEILPFGRMRKLDVAEKFFLPNGTLKTQMNTHQNISDILDNLLSGYDNRIRPDFGGKSLSDLSYVTCKGTDIIWKGIKFSLEKPERVVFHRRDIGDW